MSSFTPAAVMFYTDLESLNGLTTPIDYGSGIEYANGIFNSLFPSQDVGLQIGLWLGGKDGCDKIIHGQMEHQIQKLAHYLNECAASKVFVRVGYEFDNPWFGYSQDPDAYQEAFRHFVATCRHFLTASKKDHIKFVWHSWGAPLAKGIQLQDFYPGDDVVDWIGVSIFQQVYPWMKTLPFTRQVLEFAEQHGKPTMIAESTPYGGIDLSTNKTIAFGKADPWNRWFEPVLDLINQYDISMWSYINCNWEAQPMWHNVGFGETRLSTNPQVMEKWKMYVLGATTGDGNDSKDTGRREFLLAGSLRNCGNANRSVTAMDTTIEIVSLGLSKSKQPRWKSIAFVCILYSSLTILLASLNRRHRRRVRSVAVANTDDTVSEATPILSNTTT